MDAQQLYFTNCARGKGFDPALSGFQIKACSPGLGEDVRQTLMVVCLHYGDALYRNAPREARDAETRWRRETDSLDRMPQEVLDAFPVVWSYYRLKENLYALTRLNYTGIGPDGRIGNFFAHSLVFDPGKGPDGGINPFSLTRSSFFQPNETRDITVLEPVRDLSALLPQGDADGKNTLPVFGGRTADVISALLSQGEGNLPVVLCLPRWPEVPSLLEPLFESLPPQLRGRISFCTFENDRNWLPDRKSAQPGRSAHDLMVHCGEDDKAFKLAPHDYESKYTVFNFVGGRFSETGPAGDFAAFAASCLERGQGEKLRRLHDLAGRLGLSDVREAGDLLASVEGLYSGRPYPQLRCETLERLEKFFVREDQIRAALGILVPSMGELVSSRDEEGVRRWAPVASRWLPRLPEKERRAGSRFLAELASLAGQCLGNGNVGLCAVLLSACGNEREGIFVTVFQDYLHAPGSADTFPSIADEGRELIRFFSEAARLKMQRPELPFSLRELIRLAFHAAVASSTVPFLWDLMGKEVVRPFFLKNTDETSIQLLAELTERGSPEVCPEARLWLALRLLKAAPPEEDRWTRRVTELARVHQGDEAVTAIRKVVDESVAIPERRALIFGFLCASLRGMAGDKWRRVFRESLAAVPDSRAVLEELAGSGSHDLVCEEIMNHFLPWRPGKSEEKFREWGDLLAIPRIHENLCRTVSRQFVSGGRFESVFSLAGHLLAVPAAPPAPSQLADTVIRSTPLEFLARNPLELPETVASDLSPEASGRLRVVELLRKMSDGNEGPERVSLPVEDPVWKEDVRALPPSERKAVIDRCLERGFPSGIAIFREMLDLCAALSSAGVTRPEEIAKYILRFMPEEETQGREEMLETFARGLLDPPGGLPWKDVLSRVMRRWEPQSLLLFKEKLEVLANEAEEVEEEVATGEKTAEEQKTEDRENREGNDGDQEFEGRREEVETAGLPKAAVAKPLSPKQETLTEVLREVDTLIAEKTPKKTEGVVRKLFRGIKLWGRKE